MKKLMICLLTLCLMGLMVGCGAEEEPSVPATDSVSSAPVSSAPTPTPIVVQPTQTLKASEPTTPESGEPTESQAPESPAESPQESESASPSKSAKPSESASPSKSAEAGEATPSPSKAAAIEAGVGYIKGKDVNIREKAESSAKSVAKSKQNEMVTVTEYEYGNGWSEIKYKDKTAYVATQYLSMVSAENEKGSGKINAADVNMRYAPSTDGQAAGKLSKGAKVNVVAKNAGSEWTAIEKDGALYFVATKLIDF